MHKEFFIFQRLLDSPYQISLGNGNFATVLKVYFKLNRVC